MENDDPKSSDAGRFEDCLTYASQCALKHTIQMIKRGKQWQMPESSNSIDTVLAGLFMHPALRSGQLIHRLCLNMKLA